MRLSRSREWWLRRALAEPDCPISAGIPDASDDTRPEGGDSTKIEAPFTGGAVANGETPNLPSETP